MSLKLNSPGGGSITLQEPTTASDRTLNLPDSSTTVVGTDATQTLSNKTFSGATTFGSASLAQPDGSAPLYMCRAWVNFNGTGTVAIRASGNVSSITDDGTGLYVVNFTNTMPDSNYVVSVVGNGDAAVAYTDGTRTTSGVRVAFIDYGASFRDSSISQVAIFR